MVIVCRPKTFTIEIKFLGMGLQFLQNSSTSNRVNIIFYLKKKLRDQLSKTNVSFYFTISVLNISFTLMSSIFHRKYLLDRQTSSKRHQVPNHRPSYTNSSQGGYKKPALPTTLPSLLHSELSICRAVFARNVQSHNSFEGEVTVCSTAPGRANSRPRVICELIGLKRTS